MSQIHTDGASGAFEQGSTSVTKTEFRLLSQWESADFLLALSQPEQVLEAHSANYARFIEVATTVHEELSAFIRHPQMSLRFTPAGPRFEFAQEQPFHREQLAPYLQAARPIAQWIRSNWQSLDQVGQEGRSFAVARSAQQVQMASGMNREMAIANQCYDASLRQIMRLAYNCHGVNPMTPELLGRLDIDPVMQVMSLGAGKPNPRNASACQLQLYGQRAYLKAEIDFELYFLLWHARWIIPTGARSEPRNWLDLLSSRVTQRWLENHKGELYLELLEHLESLLDD